MHKRIPTEFQVSFLDSKPEKISETISKARVKIFYSGHNRNNSFITDEFAAHLIGTLPYSPVKGIYTVEGEDFTGHDRESRDQRIYGFVPSPMNFAWEQHLDRDGLTRNYACADVLIWDEVYEESKEILNKAQSMELFAPSIEGEWKLHEGKEVYVFKKASFLGLQVLGDKVEPAFEGASFYSKNLFSDFNLAYQALYEQLEKIEGPKIGGGNNTMFDKINKALEAAGHEGLTVVLDKGKYVIANNEAGQSFRVYFEEVEEVVTIGEMIECHPYHVTEEEREVLDKMEEEHEGIVPASKKIELVKTLEENNENLVQENENFSAKIVELEAEKATLELERETSIEAIAAFELKEIELNEKIEKVELERDTLAEFKLNIEKQEKEEVISKYAEVLKDDILENFRTNLTEYTVEQLEKDLSYEYVKSTPSLFSKEKGQDYFRKDEEQTKDSLSRTLDKYRK